MVKVQTLETADGKLILTTYPSGSQRLYAEGFNEITDDQTFGLYSSNAVRLNISHNLLFSMI